MTFASQHITMNMQLKISPPKLQEQAEHIIQYKTAMRGNATYNTDASFTDLRWRVREDDSILVR